MILLLIFGMFTARWIWVAGGEDYGWTYEPAWRILHGQLPYRDFAFSAPPLAPLILAGLMKLFGESVFIFAVNLYLSWLGALVVGVAILNLLNADRHIKVLSVVVAGTLSPPFTQVGHAHSYQAPMFAGLIIYFFLKYQKSRRAGNLFWAGIFAGIAIVAKQNIGLLFGSAATLALFIPSPWGLGIQGKRFPNIARFMAGGALGLFSFLAPFFYNCGALEVVKEMFADAGSGKGGPAVILLRGFPRLTAIRGFTMGRGLPPHAWAELLITVAVFTGICWLINRARGDAKLNSVTAQDGHASREDTGNSTVYYVCFFASAFAASVATLFYIPRIYIPLEVLRLQLADYNLFPIRAAYLIAFSSGIACLIAVFRRRAPRELGMLCLLLLALMYANAASGSSYFGFVAPIAVPMLLYVLAAGGLPNLFRPCLLLATLFLMTAFFFPAYGEAFGPLLPLPRNSPFAGLYGYPRFYRLVTGLWLDVTPRIKGQPTLWLYPGGPLSAFGGLPVPNVVYLHTESYNSRSEKRFWDDWHRDPPAYVILGQFARARNAVLFQEASLQSWLSSDYELVWRRQDLEMTLWKKRALLRSESPHFGGGQLGLGSPACQLAAPGGQPESHP